jgi:hypothetical protein
VNAVVIGVDPGVTTGIVALHVGRVSAGEAPCSPSVVQCDHLTALTVIDALAGVNTGTGAGDPVVLAAESFVVSGRSARSTNSQAGRITQDLLAELKAWPVFTRVLVRPAGAVKPWATDERLAAAGLLVPDMRHARDAGRHALFAAVHDYAQPDPLSSRAGSR